MVNLFIRQHGKEDNEVPLQYPWLWLRDNCQCSTCFHPVAQNRTFNMDQLDVTVKPINVQVKITPKNHKLILKAVGLGEVPGKLIQDFLHNLELFDFTCKKH